MGLTRVEWVLFDADETLFHFDALAGLQRLFLTYDIAFSEADYLDYQAVNQALWIDYQDGVINALQLQQRRFNGWSQKLGVTSEVLNLGYQDAMAEVSIPLEGAASLLRQLHGKVKMGIITNGFTALQQARLENTGLQDYFELLVISEQVGYAKPNPAIFDYALERMGSPDRQRVLMVGDNPDTDVAGGIQAGLQTCWLNVNGRACPKGIWPDIQVSSLSELENMLVASLS